MTRRWLVTGAAGMLGTDLVNELQARGESVVAVDREDFDITDGGAVAAALEEIRPTIVVNCAAYTQVDAAEEHESVANGINGSAVEILAHAANRAGALLVQISTDFVFDGSRRTPYEVNHPVSPISAYGRSKLLGEQAAAQAGEHLIVRTAWLFGTRGPNFVEAIRNQVRKGTNPLRVVDDQRGRPTYTPHLAHALIRLSMNDQARGIVHYADEGECTWFDFARAIVEELQAPTEVVPVTTAEFPRPAQRPAYSVLSTERYERLTGVRPESWRDGLHEYLALKP